MAAILAFILLAVLVFLPPGLPSGSKKAKFKDVFSTDERVNRLSLARVFLFAARDTWFVVGIPIYFYSVLSDGSSEQNARAFFLIGSFMALWIIGYGAVQATVPRLMNARDKPVSEIASLAARWAIYLSLLIGCVALSVLVVGASSSALTAFIVLGLLAFGFVFAVNSSVHSYLILAFTTGSRVTMDVGFYYMSNACGRLLGTLMSGLSFQFGGLALCLLTAPSFSFLSWISARRLTAN
jgi:hypothetical protein